MAETNDWITELDGIEPFPVPVAKSILGRMPPELLQIVTEYLSQRDLPAAACISRPLQALAERCLYNGINIPYDPNVDYPCEEVEEGLGYEIWPLYRTLSARSDLAKRVKTLNILIIDRSLGITADSKGVFPGGLLFSSDLDMRLPEATIAGALLQLLSAVESLTVHFVEEDGDGDADISSRPTSDCMAKLFPGFNSRTAHLRSLTAVQKVKELEWNGSEFHWMLARSPHLTVLNLTRSSTILPDEAPNETNAALEQLRIDQSSALLNPAATQHETLKPFLAHFPGLKQVLLHISDRRHHPLIVPNEHILTHENQGSFATLLTKLETLAPCLNTLFIMTSRYSNDPHASAWLNYALPSAGFAHFKSLRYLCVPYQSLFGPVDAQWSHVTPSPAELLPSTLEHLELAYPRVAVYDWLARFPSFHEKLPALRIVELACSGDYGDAYNEFAFECYPHPALAALQSIDVALKLETPKWQWQKAWDDYDIPLFDKLWWFRSFGSPCVGMIWPYTFLPSSMRKLTRCRHGSQVQS